MKVLLRRLWAFILAVFGKKQEPPRIEAGRPESKDEKLRASIIRLAHENPELRGYLMPLLKDGGPGQAGQVLVSQGAGQEPQWDTLVPGAGIDINGSGQVTLGGAPDIALGNHTHQISLGYTADTCKGLFFEAADIDPSTHPIQNPTRVDGGVREMVPLADVGKPGTYYGADFDGNKIPIEATPAPEPVPEDEDGWDDWPLGRPE